MSPTGTDWVAVHDALAADRDGLDAAGLDELGVASWFLGLDEECEQAWESACRASLDAGDPDGAVRTTLWLGFTLGERGEPVKARAWMARLLELSDGRDVPATAAIRALCEAYTAWQTGRTEASVESGERALALARLAGDDDIATLAAMGLGRSLIALDRVEEGFACLDRVMLTIGEGRVGDRVAGPAYCAVISSCLARWDLERARGWTRELSDWCDAQRGLETFRGECSVNRAAILRVGGEWREARAALAEVAARERRPETLENALYALGELDRLAGRTDAANAAFRRAAELGREVQPGLARLRRDTGRAAAARAGLVRALETAFPGDRAELLATQVELELDGGDPAVARRAAAELGAIAEFIGTDYLHALADRATATVLLADGSAPEALPRLRRAWAIWRRLGATYDAALTRVQLGRAARALGDEEGAQLEFDAARGVLAELGAIPDLARLERIAAPSAAPSPGGLSPREVEVVRLVAAGHSNREIASRLFLSERTVARHVSNILAKLGLASRSGATAYAFEHGLVISADAAPAARS